MGLIDKNLHEDAMVKHMTMRGDKPHDHLTYFLSFHTT